MWVHGWVARFNVFMGRLLCTWGWLGSGGCGHFVVVDRVGFVVVVGIRRVWVDRVAWLILFFLLWAMVATVVVVVVVWVDRVGWLIFFSYYRLWLSQWWWRWLWLWFVPKV